MRQTTVSRNITIKPVTDPPLVAEVKATSLQDTPVIGTFSAIDQEQKPLTFSLGCLPRQGQAELRDSIVPGEVSYQYIPDEKTFGTDSFVVLVNNGDVTNAELVRRLQGVT